MSGALNAVCHPVCFCHLPRACTRAQFAGRELVALPGALYEQTSLRELHVSSCRAAQQLVVSKLTALTVLKVRVVVTSSSTCVWRYLGPQTTHEWHLIDICAALLVRFVRGNRRLSSSRTAATRS